MTGRADYFELGDWNAMCYQCGRKRKASTLVRHWQGHYVCPEHWEPRQTQDFVRNVPDNQTPPWAQPIVTTTYAASCFPNGRTAIPGYAIPGCVMPNYTDPLFTPDVTN
jgi:hypothetical protein